MISVNIKEHIDLKALVERAEKAKKKAVMAVAMSLKKEADPYVRWQTGATFRSAALSDFAEGEIKYDTPYARYAYYNERSKVTKDVHPLACARWAEVAWNAKKDRFIALFNNIIKEAIK